MRIIFGYEELFDITIRKKVIPATTLGEFSVIGEASIDRAFGNRADRDPSVSTLSLLDAGLTSVSGSWTLALTLISFDSESTGSTARRSEFPVTVFAVY